MNKKGFTLVEVLASVAIIGILSGIAVTAIGGNIAKSRKQAYDSIMESAYDAALNYYMDNDIVEPTDVSLQDLVDASYLEEPVDPKKDGTFCYKNSDNTKTSFVRIVPINQDENARFVVYLYCPSSSSEIGIKTYND